MAESSLSVINVPVLHAEFVDSKDPRWTDLLATTRSDVYHDPFYSRLLAQECDGEALIFVAEERERLFLVPLVVRPITQGITGLPDHLVDATSPYGYPGPLLTPAARLDECFLERSVSSFIDALRARGVISCFIRLHPLLPIPFGPLQKSGSLVHHGDTVSIDLRLSNDILWRQIRENHRRDIAKAERTGLTVRMDATWEQFDTFVDIYHENMRRVDAADFYIFSRDYLLQVRQALGDRIHLCVTEVDGNVAAAGLFTETNGIVQYHLSGTQAEFVPLHPIKSMFQFVTDWGQRRGNQTFHLGGGLGGKSDSLFKFKAGFSPLRHPFHTWRIVAIEDAFDALVQQSNSSGHEAEDSSEDFFPAYRRPAM
jgi:CelD/BcsL family acetyltransferase involved in cellulose biosynthesis